MRLLDYAADKIFLLGVNHKILFSFGLNKVFIIVVDGAEGFRLVERKVLVMVC